MDFPNLSGSLQKRSFISRFSHLNDLSIEIIEMVAVLQAL